MSKEGTNYISFILKFNIIPVKCLYIYIYIFIKNFNLKLNINYLKQFRINLDK
jgi:hypothetical protein